MMEDLNIRKTVLYLLYSQAKEDGFIHPFELNHIEMLAEEFGFKADIIDAIEDGTFQFEFSIPKEEHERVEILYHLLFLSQYDQNISDREVSFMRNLSTKLGLREELILDMIEVMKSRLGRDVPSEMLLSVLRKYLN